MIYNDDNRDAAGVPEPLAARMLDAIIPAAPPAGVSEGIRARLMTRLGANAAASAGEAASTTAADTHRAGAVKALADAFITLHASTQPGEGWVELLPKAHARLLFTDGEGESYMIRLEPGAWAPEHEHPADEECLVLE